MTGKVKLNLPGINKIMTSKGARAVVRRELQRMEVSAGEGFEAVERPHRWTARGFVQTADVEGARRQAREKVLERVVSEKQS
jgi:hypothetical protein